MGLFNNFEKPGPGIDKDAPQKRGIFLFFEIFWRKFKKLFQANMLYFIFSIPVLCLYFFVSTPTITQFITSIGAMDTNIPETIIERYATVSVVFYMFTMTILLGSGPASAALAYIQRCFAREEHSFILFDFFGKMRENLKQSVVVAVLDVVVVNLVFIALRFYYNQYIMSGATLFLILACAMVVFMLVYIFAHYYIYQLMVTVELKTKDLYKNAFLLALATAPVNIVLTVIISALCVGVYILLEPDIAIVLSFFIVMGALRFPIEFYAQSVIKRKLLSNTEDSAE